jgi:hypothetical protein
MEKKKHTVPTERNLTPERTLGSLPGSALGSLLKLLRFFWVRYLGALYELICEAEPAFILLSVSPAPFIFQTFTYYPREDPG